MQQLQETHRACTVHTPCAHRVRYSLLIVARHIKRFLQKCCINLRGENNTLPWSLVSQCVLLGQCPHKGSHQPKAWVFTNLTGAHCPLGPLSKPNPPNCCSPQTRGGWQTAMGKHDMLQFWERTGRKFIHL